MSTHLPLVGLMLALCASFAGAQSIPVTLGSPEPMPRQLYVLNTDMMTAIAFQGASYDSPQVEEAIRVLRPQGLRFPGGTLANNYLWAEDSFSAPTNDKTGWAAEQLTLFRKIGRPCDLVGFARVSRRNGLSTVWVLNIYEETPESTLALFDKLDSLGVKVTAVEMANEPYWDGRSLADVQSYIKASRPIAEMLKRHRPNIKIGACFAPFGNPANYEVIWNGPLAEEDWFDAIVFHEYYGGQGFVLEQGSKISADAMLHPEAMIEDPLAKLNELMPGKPIWYTEWNVGMEGLDQWKNTGAELQYIAAMFSSLIEHRDKIDMACFHAFYDSRFGVFYLDDKTGAMETNASYEFFRLLGIVFADAEALRPIEFGPDDLCGFATQHEDDIRLFVLNRGSTPRELEMPALMTGKQVRMTIDCPPDRKLPRSTSLVTRHPVAGATTTLPAYSINLIGRVSTLDFKPKIVEADNLFPRRPDLLFWYPPYASQQPRFDREGVYTIDLGQCKDKSLAVLKMDLASSKLEAKREYTLEFEAKAEGDGGLIVTLPQPGDAKGVYTLIGQSFNRHRYTFKYDPSSNQGEVAIVFAEDMIRCGSIISLRSFCVSASE